MDSRTRDENFLLLSSHIRKSADIEYRHPLTVQLQILSHPCIRDKNVSCAFCLSRPLEQQRQSVYAMTLVCDFSFEKSLRFPNTARNVKTNFSFWFSDWSQKLRIGSSSQTDDTTHIYLYYITYTRSLHRKNVCLYYMLWYRAYMDGVCRLWNVCTVHFRGVWYIFFVLCRELKCTKMTKAKHKLRLIVTI